MRSLVDLAMDLELDVSQEVLGGDLDEMQPETVPISDLGLDDSSVVDFHEALQDVWNLRIPEIEMERWEMVSDIVDSIVTRIPEADV
jgi:acyl carrier protein